MAIRRTVDDATPRVRALLAEHYRHIIEMYEHVPEASLHWGRDLENVESGAMVYFNGWMVRGSDLPVNGRYYLMPDDRVVPAVRVGDEIVPADRVGSKR